MNNDRRKLSVLSVVAEISKSCQLMEELFGPSKNFTFWLSEKQVTEFTCS
jgi:hypothetical protein